MSPEKFSFPSQIAHQDRWVKHVHRIGSVCSHAIELWAAFAINLYQSNPPMSFSAQSGVAGADRGVEVCDPS